LTLCVPAEPSARNGPRSSVAQHQPPYLGSKVSKVWVYARTPRYEGTTRYRHTQQRPSEVRRRTCANISTLQPTLHPDALLIGGRNPSHPTHPPMSTSPGTKATRGPRPRRLPPRQVIHAKLGVDSSVSRAIDVVLSAGLSTTSATPAILVMTKVLKTCYTSHYRVTITFSVNIGVNPRGAQRSQFIPRRPEVGRRTSSQPTHTSRRMVSYSDGTVDRSTILARLGRRRYRVTIAVSTAVCRRVRSSVRTGIGARRGAAQKLRT